MCIRDRTNIVDVYIRYLRGKIDLPGQKSYIKTVRGIGYAMQDALEWSIRTPVSYTHLDVYKRQGGGRRRDDDREGGSGLEIIILILSLIAIVLAPLALSLIHI